MASYDLAKGARTQASGDNARIYSKKLVFAKVFGFSLLLSLILIDFLHFWEILGIF
jgi:hypothetical protein